MAQLELATAKAARRSRNFIQEIYCVLLEDYRPPAEKKTVLSELHKQLLL